MSFLDSVKQGHVLSGNGMYELPSADNVSKVVLDESVVDGDNKPLLIYEQVLEDNKLSEENT